MQKEKVDFKRLFKRFIQWRSFLWAIPVTIIMWHWATWLMYQYDPTAKGLDAGYLVDLFVAAASVLFAFSVAFLGMKFTNKPMYDYYRSKTDNGMTQYHRDIQDLRYENQSHRWKNIFFFWLFLYSTVAAFLYALSLLR